MQKKHEATSQSLSIASAEQALDVDLCVIGAGSGGLSVAAVAAALGEKVVLIEKHKMGGDCLNYGCVPSKALLAAARRAHQMRTCAAFGIEPVEPKVDWAEVKAHVAGVIEAIAPNDSAERFTGMGVRVLSGTGKFVDAKTVAVGETTIKARKFVIATGSSPGVPDIPGLNSVPYLTNETLFSSPEPIGHLIIVGAGPIGLEMAQAHLRLGARVTVLEAKTALPKDEPELVEVVLRTLRSEGVALLEGVEIVGISGKAGSIEVEIEGPGDDGALLKQTVAGTHLLIAAGRKPNVRDMNLEGAGIAFDATGIKVDGGQRTSNRRVYAIGDCAQGLKFTHVANYQAGLVIRRALFKVPAVFKRRVVPWVTFTEPELAQAGFTEAEARALGYEPRVLRWSFHDNDRAQAERETHGHIKVLLDRGGRILGCGIVGAHAGELIGMWSLAISQGLKIKAMTDWVAPYPTLSEVSKRAATRAYADVASSPRVRKLLAWLKKLG